MSEYGERDIESQDDYYLKHISAMTSENLHSKTAIAAELAHRDMIIDQLQAERDRYKEALEAIIKHNESISMTGNYKLPMTTTVIAQKALGGSDE